MLDRKNLTASTVAMYVVVVAAAVVTAAVIGPAVTSALQETDEEEPVVTVLTFRGGTSGTNVNQITEDLREARTNDSVEAVVLRIDSPGGPVTSSEEFYLAVNRTARELPVVAYVEGAAASGGYFGVVASDEIVVKPSSNVGSIGVVVAAPISLIELVGQQQESFVRSGPDKAQISPDSIRNNLETLQSTFVGTVMQHRGDELDLSREEVANGNVYLGTRAVENGFADRIGDLNTAIERAAALSEDIEGDRYDVTYVEQPQPLLGLPFAKSDVKKVEGNVVYVDTDNADIEFVRPVRYYAVWGVPVTQENATEVEVIADG